MDYKKLVLYFATGLVLLLLWNAWQRDYGGINIKPAEVQQNQTEGGNSALNTNNISPSTAKNQDNYQPSTVSTSSGSELIHVTPAKLIHVKTDVLNVTIDPLGGSLVKATLPKYPVSLKQPNNPFPLLNYNKATYYVAQSGMTHLTGVKKGLVPFQTEKNNYQLEKGKKALRVVLHWKSKNGINIKKTLVFKRGKYVVKMNEKITNHSNDVWKGRYFMQTKRRDMPKGSSHVLGFHTFFGIAISSPDKPYNKIKFADLNDSPVNKTITTGWLAFIQHYFLTAWVPNAKIPYY